MLFSDEEKQKSLEDGENASFLEDFISYLAYICGASIICEAQNRRFRNE